MTFSRRSLLASCLVALSLLAAEAARAQPYTRNVYNHSSQSVTCPTVCTMTPTICGPGQSCTVYGWGFSAMSVVGTAPLPQVIWQFTPNPSYQTDIYSYVASTSGENLWNFLSLELLDTGSTVSLSVNTTTIAENGGQATITATRSGALSADPTLVEIDFFGGTATLTEPPGDGDDFTQPGPAVWKAGNMQRNVYILTIPANQRTGTLTLTGKNDAVAEPDETIKFKINGASSATWSTAELTVTIVDDDSMVTLGVDTASVPETGGVATVTASLSPVNASRAVTVALGFSGTATSPADYTASAASITIPAGQASGSITLSAVNDAINEPDETVVVDVTGVTNGTESGTQQVTVTIVDDDVPQATLELAGSPLAESGGVATVTARLNRAAYQPVAVSLGFGGTATYPGDYVRSAETITIPAGSLTGTATLTGVADSIDEPDETVVVDITGVTGAIESGEQQVTATIVDDDPPPTVTLELSGSPLAENGGVATVTARLSAVSGQAVTVNLGFTGTATYPGDYLRSAEAITIPAGSLTGTVTLTGVDDTTSELAETVIVDVTSVTNGTESGTQQVTATITDDDAPLVTLELAGSPLAENGGVATVTARLDRVTYQPVTVNLGFTGTATYPGDYLRSAEAITIPAGSLTGTATLTGVDDAIDEPDETVVVDITSVTNGVESGTQQVTATIVDDDPPPTVTLELSGSPLVENGGVATLTARLDRPTYQPVTVNLGFTGTATYPGDYTRSASAITIPAGSLTGTATLTGVDDTADEPDETVVVDITGVTNGTESGTQQVTATITDDDPAPTVTLELMGSPLAENGGVATLTARLDRLTYQPVTVNLGFTGTATYPGDYVRSAEMITIPAGSLTGTATLTGVDDTADEPDETVVVDVTSVTNGTESGTQQVTATITDDDPAPTVTLELSGSPLAENGGVATVTARLNRLTYQPVTVNLGFTGTATYPGDYTRSAETITIPAGSLTGTATLTGVDDTADEPDETVVVDITGVTNGTESGTQQVTATITDDDPAPTVTLELMGSPLAENGGVATLTARLGAVSGQAVTVNLGFTGTATFPGDYLRSASAITIPAGSLTGTATLTGVDDAIDEPDETVVVDITSVTNGTESGAQQVTATITDDDPPPTVTLELAGSPLAENGGVATVTARLGAVSGQAVTVNLGFTGTATYPGDYTRSASAITIPAGSLTGTATLTGVDDTADEPDETVIVDIIGVTNGTESGTQQVTATITDDDPAPSVTLELAGSPLIENGGVATLTARLDRLTYQPVTVNLGFTGTATYPADYTRSASAITIPAGSLTGTATLTGVDDAIDEPDETVIVDVISVTNGTESGTQQVTATITDDDPPPTVTLELTGSPLAENGGVATVTARLGAVSGQAVTVNLGFTGTATYPGDYTRSATAITIPAGSLTGTATLTGVDDSADEPDETVVVDITGVTNGTESGTQQVTATITDDDPAPSVTLELAGSPLAENGGVATLTARLDRLTYQPVTVSLGFGGTAVHPGDYLRSATAITIPAGSLTGTATLTGVDDTADEPDETVIVDIIGVTNGTESGTQQVTATITDDDPPPAVTLELAGSPLAENGGVATLTARLDRLTYQPVTVNLGFGGTAVHPGDYARSAETITIPAGSLTGTATLTGVNDATSEPDETVVVDITGVTNGTESGTQQVTATITDDDAPRVTLELAGSPLAENGGVATVTARLDRPTYQEVTVNLAFGGTATHPGDYVRSAAAIAIPTGSLTGTATLTGVDDATSEPDETIVVDVTTVTNASAAGVQRVTATIVDDDPARLVFVSQPSMTVVNDVITPAVTVQVVDWSSRPVSSAASVTLALGANPGGSTLAGLTTASAVAGLATFGDLSLDVVADGYTLAASSADLTGATSEPFDVKRVPVTTFSGPSATLTGQVRGSFTGGGAACTFVDTALLAQPPGTDPVPPTKPRGLVFPHGLLGFRLADCIPGSEVSFTIEYPQPLPEGTQYWKYGPPSAGAPPSWYVLPATIDGRIVTFKIVDGGVGDGDGLPDGNLIDPGGPAFAPARGSAEIPTLSEWALGLLALMLAGLGFLMSRSGG